MSRYIDADILRDNIDEWLDTVGYCTIGKGLSYYGELIGCIKDTPTADVEEVRHGEWLYIPETLMTCAVFECSECKCYQLDPHTKSNMQFCPRCGANMDGGKK